ncbi:MAG: hypothetical protein ACXWE6_14090 [Nitrososphaeraceae archaeon]
MGLKIPTHLFVDGISERKVYYFSSTHLNNEVPHYFICIKRTDDNYLILTCCTSQFESRRRHIELQGLPYTTLVYITPNDSENPFDRDTYVDCNKAFTYSLSEFIEMYESDRVSYSGEVSEVHYEQILIGLHDSPEVEEELKDLLPQPE